MAELPLATAPVEPEANQIITAINNYVAGLRYRSDRKSCLDGVAGLHHMLDAVRDGFDLGLAHINDGPVAISQRDIAAHLDISPSATQDHLRMGRRLAQGEPRPDPRNSNRHPASARRAGTPRRASTDASATSGREGHTTTSTTEDE